MSSLGLIYQEYFKMKEERTIASIARIEVQQSFCNNCSVCIKNKLKGVEDIANVRLYPRESLVTFNFIRPNRLADVLNILSDLGYPEKGERVFETTVSKSLCRC